VFTEHKNTQWFSVKPKKGFDEKPFPRVFQKTFQWFFTVEETFKGSICAV
jgi:hypothetical protein